MTATPELSWRALVGYGSRRWPRAVLVVDGGLAFEFGDGLGSRLASLGFRRRDDIHPRLYELRDGDDVTFWRATDCDGFRIMLDITEEVDLRGDLMAAKRGTVERMGATMRRLERSNRMDPEGWQEQHSPTEAVEVVISRSVKVDHTGRAVGVKRTTEIARRRKMDARLWESLTPHQQEAADRIYLGFEILTRGLGISGMSLERRDPSNDQGPSDGGQAIVDWFWDWSKQAQLDGLKVSQILDILVWGKSRRQVDRERRQRKGTAGQQLDYGLDLYCKLRGWPIAKRGP